MIARLNYYIQSFVINKSNVQTTISYYSKEICIYSLQLFKIQSRQKQKAKRALRNNRPPHKTQLKYKIQSKSYMAKYVFVYTPDVILLGYLP